MPPHLRAFLFDSTYGSGQSLVENVFSSWEKGEGVCIIPTSYPTHLIDASIIRCDPSDVVDLATGDIQRREMAIIETPDLAAVVLTSGTTDDPKPVELSFESMRESAHALYRTCHLNSDDVWLCCLPPHYVAGLAIFARCFTTGSRLVFHERFDTSRVEQAIRDESVTAISVVASQLHHLLDARVDLSPLKTILVGGSAIDEQLVEKCAALHLPIHRTYGMTETWGGICHDGLLFDNTQARITDGIIELTTTSLMSGYRHNYPATLSRMTTDDWFITHDRGELNNGLLKVLGRSDDVINSGGIKVDPEPLEELLRTIYPNNSFIVCATSHSQYGQCVTLCFLETESDIPALSRVRDSLKAHIASTHMPLRVGTVPDWPKTTSGKIQRSRIEKIYTIIDEHSQG